jgi:tetraacyldisaccharide 4'-kinase
VSAQDIVHQIWYGDGRLAAASRLVLFPAERLFGGVVGLRDILYDVGWLSSHEAAIPVVSIGNLTVGGTGKTPVAAWVASGLAARGAQPAVVLRGYGEDEPLVHQRLNPSIPVIVNPDRTRAVATAAAGGATIAVLDDAFQHRAIRRNADLVLVSADRWTPDVRVLPAGPWREPLSALRRATLVIVTSRAADPQRVDEVHKALALAAPAVPRVSVRLSLADLVRADDDLQRRPLEALRGARVLAVASIADPVSFLAQLRALGAVVAERLFRDHHTFSDAEIDEIASQSTAFDYVVCTLKDAVKLGPRWTRAPGSLERPLWYVSQQVMVERGVGGLEHVLDELVHSRSGSSPTAG